MSDNTNNEVAVIPNRAIAQMSAISSGVGIMTSMRDDNIETRKATLAAVTNAENVADHLDETIELVHVVMQAVTLTDEKTGEETDHVRTILLAADGTAYAAISDGLVGALRDIYGIMGEPASWPAPLPVKVVEKRGRSGFRFYKIELA